MTKQISLQRIGLLVVMIVALLVVNNIQASAQKKDYVPGEKIEYKSSGYPETWEEVTFVGTTPDGSQPIIRQKPNEFSKEGFQRAASWAEIRTLSARAAVKTPASEIKAEAKQTAPGTIKDFGKGLLTQAEILSFLQTRVGDKPYENPRRAEILKELAEMMKRRGLDFRDSSLHINFNKQLAKYGANTSDISFPLRDNYGAPTQQSWLMGVWKLGKIGAAVDHVKNNRVYRQGEIGVANVGTLTLNANGTYVWKSVTAQSTHGKWRKATEGEMKSQGGDGIVLLKAKSGYNWMVSKNRSTTLPGQWIFISELETRQINEYGSRGGTK